MSESLYEEVMKDIVAIEERIDELEERMERLEHLAERVDDLDARTDMMQLVDDSDDLDAEARSIRLLQHMQRKANRQGMDKIGLTRDQAAEALHFPDVDRTVIYTDMRRCVRLVGDDDICWYEGQDEGTLDEAAVFLRYTAFRRAAGAGEVPADVVESTEHNGGA